MDTNERNRVVIRKTRPQYSKEQKAGFAFVAVTGTLAVVLGSLYVVRHVASPFDLHYEGPEFVSAAEEKQRQVEAQKQQDTDGDTLTDYDELYIYRTSPYVRDTDGDGVNDPDEITAGTDPTCVGDSCNQGIGNVFDTPGSSSGNFAMPDGVVPDFGPVIPEQDVNEQIQAISNLSSDEVRELLVSGGANPEEVAALSDEELMQLYQSVIADLQTETPPTQEEQASE